MRIPNGAMADYRRTVNQANETHYAETNTVNASYPNAGNGGFIRVRQEGTEETRAAYEAGIREANAKRDATIAEAMTQFIPKGTDETSAKMITYMVTSGIINDYPDHSDEIMRQLPATYSELLTFGHGRGWCNTFDMLLNRAVSNGALEDTRTGTERLDEIKREFGMSNNHSTRLTNAVNALVAEKLAAVQAEAAATEPVAEAVAAE